MFQDCPGCTPPIVRTLSLLAATVVIVMVLAFEALSPIASTDDAAPAENAEYDDSGDSAEGEAPPKQTDSTRDWPSHVQIVGTPVPQEEPNGEALEPDPPNRFFDDGHPDMLSGRETAFERWTEENSDIWDLLDTQLRECVYMSYVNAFGKSPEAGIDWCLAQAERADGEEKDAD